MIPLSIYKIGVPVGLFAYYVFRLFRIYILKSNMELKFPTLYTLFLGLGIPASLFLVNVNIRMYNFDDVQCTIIPSVAYGFVTGMNLQLC